MPATLLDEEKMPVKNITGIFSFSPVNKIFSDEIKNLFYEE